MKITKKEALIWGPITAGIGFGVVILDNVFVGYISNALETFLFLLFFVPSMILFSFLDLADFFSAGLIFGPVFNKSYFTENNGPVLAIFGAVLLLLMMLIGFEVFVHDNIMALTLIVPIYFISNGLARMIGMIR